MSFRQRMFVILLLVLMAAGITYAGIDHNKALAADEEISDDVTTVYFWYSDDSLTDFFTTAAVVFHKNNPDVRVIPTLVDSTEYLEAINEASLGDSEFPDAYLVVNDSLEKAYMSGLASKVRDTDGVLNSAFFSDAALDAVTYKGEYVAYPLYFETSVLMYNKTYLSDWAEKINSGEVEDTGDDGDIEIDEDYDPYAYDDFYYDGEAGSEGDDSGYDSSDIFSGNVTAESLVPETFEDIMTFAESYEAPSNVDAVLKWDVTDIFYNYLFVGNYLVVGGDSGDNISNISINNDDAIACMEFYQSMNQYFSIDADTSDYETMLNDFLDGKFVYTIVTSDAIAKVEESVAEKTAQNLQDTASGAETVTEVYDFGYAVIPDISTELLTRSLSVTNAVAVNGYSVNKDAANRFAAFLCTEYAENMYSDTGKISACIKNDSENDAVSVFRNEYATSMPLPKIVETSNLWVQLEIAFTEIWSGTDVTTRMQSLSDQILSQIGRQ